MGSYYLKSERDWYKKHYIRLIRHRAYGNDYVVLFDVLMHEAIDHDGVLRNSKEAPYDTETMLMVAFSDCLITAKDIIHYRQIVVDGVELFKQLDLIEILEDGSLYMKKLPDLIAKTSADRVRKWRETHKTDHTGKSADVTLPKRDDVTKVTPHSVESKVHSTKTIDNSKEEEPKPLPQPSIDYSMIVNRWNAIAELPHIIGIEGKRRESVQARVRESGFEQFIKMIDAVAVSSFLRGKKTIGNKTPFMATFDWCIKPNNFPKIVEGNYPNEDQAGHKDDNDRRLEAIVEMARRSNQ